MSDDIHIRVEGHAGRITLTRPQALNAMTYEMCLAIEGAFDAWADDDAVSLVILDATGDRAFCSGGDIAELFETGTKGDFAYGQRFWADEYRLNHKIFTFPKPVVSFLQGFTMGGGVGIGCHGSHRIVGETSQIAMPECGIGLVPDVGGSFMLAKAPGRLGEYLGTTGTRMAADDAIFAGFADTYVQQSIWIALIEKLEKTGDTACIASSAKTPPNGTFRDQIDLINTYFDGSNREEIMRNLCADGSAFAATAAKNLTRNAPLSVACAIEMMKRLRGPDLTIQQALELEYRFTFRAAEHGDFLEGIRAAIIDKDRTPKWQFADMNVPDAAVTNMLAPLGENALKLE